MAWSTPSSRTTGTLITAAIWNSDVVDNPIALRGGAIAIASQAALDFLYASSATQFARLANGSAYQVPRMNGGATGWEFADGSVVTSPWTPVIGGSGGTSGQTYTLQEGRSVKIGKLVFASFEVILSNKGTITGDVQLQGFPYTSVNAASVAAAVNLSGFSALATSWIWVVGIMLANSTAARMQGRQSAGAGMTTLATADIGNTTQFDGAVVYEAA